MDNVLGSMVIGKFYYIIDTKDGLNYIVELTKIDGHTLYGHGLFEGNGEYRDHTESHLLELLDTDIVTLATDKQVAQLKTAKKLATGATLKELKEGYR